MAEFEKLSNPAKLSVQTQLNRLLPASLVPLGGGQPEALSTSIWSLGADDLEHLERGQALETVAKPLERWHHQVLVAGRPVATAESGHSSKDQDEWEVKSISVSSEIAKKYEQAITWIDVHHPGEGLVRQLEIRAYRIVTLWLQYRAANGDKVDRILVVDAPSSYGLKVGSQLLPPDDFARSLRGKQAVRGLG